MNILSKKEFKEQLMLITKYGGDVDKFLDENICTKDTFSLNDTIRGTLTESGAELYNKHYTCNKKVGSKIEIQLHTLCDVFGGYGYGCGQLPLVNCEFVNH